MAIKVLERKQKKAAGYRIRPLWLILYVTDLMGQFDASVDLLGSLPEIAPFEFVIDRGQRSQAVWMDRHYVAFAV